MELSAVGERVFAAESIIKRRIRKVGVSCNGPPFSLSVEYSAPVILLLPCKLIK